MNFNVRDTNQIGKLLLLFLVISMFLIFACSPKRLQVNPVGQGIEAGDVTLIQRIDVSEDQERSRITIQGTSPLTYTVFKRTDVPRIVVDVHNADLGELTRIIEVDNGTVKKIKSTQFDNGEGKVSRIEIGLEKIVDYQVVKDGDRLILYVSRYMEREETSVGEIGTVENIDFKRMMGKSQVIVSTSRKAKYDLSKVSENTLVLELVEMEIPERLQEKLEVAGTENAVRLIKPYESTISGVKAVKIDIKLRTMVPYHVFQEKNIIYLDFDQPQEALSKETYAGASSASSTAEPQAETAIRTEKGAVVIGSALQEEGEGKKYTGKKMSMDFQDADVKNVLRLIADVSNLNVVAGSDVKGTVTMRMVDVRWDHALDVILSITGLEMARDGNIIRVASAGKFRKQEALEKLVTEILYLNYAVAKDIKNRITLSPRGKVSADERTNALIINDVQASVLEAKEILRELDTPTRQVLIEARIVQSNPTFTSEIGIQWGGSTNVDSSSDHTVYGAAGGNYAINLAASAAFGGLGYGYLSNSTQLDLVLTAMEKDEKVKIISRPKVVTLDNEQATIEQGVALPYLKMTEEGTVSTEFKDATLKLDVTPHITPDGSVIMEVMAKKDQKSSQTGYGGEPGIDTRKAETKVLVKNGETTVIGGIYERVQQTADSGVPFFSKIPVLGWLFKNTFEKDEVTELLIFITPTIVEQEPAV